MELTLSTPSLLFPAISLLLLAYTNRFLAVAALIRDLHAKRRANGHPNVVGQIDNLRRRVALIKHMQASGTASLLLCVLCMFVLFAGLTLLAKVVFSLSLLLMIASLALSVWEIWISVTALNLELADLEYDRARGEDA